MKFYSEIFTAGQAKQIPIGSSRTVSIRSTTDPIRIRFILDGGQSTEWAEQVEAGVKFQSIDEPIKSLEIISATAQTITFLVSNLLVSDDRVRGSVDAAITDAISGQAVGIAEKGMMAYYERISGGANFSHGQLRNPAASGVNLVLKAINLKCYGSPATAEFQLAKKTSAKTTDLGTSITVTNKKLDGAAGAGVVTTQEAASFTPTVQQIDYAAIGHASGAVRHDFVFQGRELIVPPGEALVLLQVTNTGKFGVSWEWVEESA